jgi:23S rRNA (cytidine1920-2'-O)/16S rRNA (cytidine1409-2'-O)-methyltransferase
VTRLRADARLVALGLCESLDRARTTIMAGRVFDGERRVEKPGELVGAAAELRLREGPRFVSRGGDKLDAALASLCADGAVRVEGAIAVDVGASTGGFTDVLLQRGAARVYAVDVGEGLLHPKLRSDPRVVVREGVNAKTLEASSFDAPIDLVVVDASFVGLATLLPALARILGDGGSLVAMVKPQFEAPREVASRGRGVVKGEERRLAIERARAAIESAGFVVRGAIDSAVAGPRGNVEHFVAATRSVKPTEKPDASREGC